MRLKFIVSCLSLVMWTAVVHGDQLKVVFLGESSLQDVVWQYRVACLRHAAKAVGVDFDAYFAEGDYARHAELIVQHTARGADVIIGPWWDALAYNEAIDHAIRQGVCVYGLLGVAPRSTLPDDLSAKVGWMETDWRAYGRLLAQHAYEATPQGGQILWPAETAQGIYINEALEGFRSFYADRGQAVAIAVLEVGFDATTAAETISQYLKAHPHVRTIATSGAIAIEAANDAVKRVQLKPTDIVLIGQVVSPAAIRGISEGYMRTGINLELTDSSYHALLDVFASAALGATPRHSTVGFVMITKDNIATALPLALLQP